MDYSKITADPVRGPEIGQLYLNASPFITTLARHAYSMMADQVTAQFRELSNTVRVRFELEDPYTDAEEMFADVWSGWLRVYQTAEDQRHPLLGVHGNDMFRAVHDYYGHFQTGRGFDRHGEEAAWVRHSRMFTGLARDAMTTETRGQSSALCWITSPEFPPQKAVLLPSWVARIPERWTA
jgi:hypothetical protein